MASQPPPPDKTPGGLARQFALATELPFILVAAVLVGGGIGYFLDRSLHTKPYLMLAMGAVGFIVGVRDLLRRLQKDDPDGSGKSG
jgi:ATP synthase protein I